jgi:hypothetical protein
MGECLPPPDRAPDGSPRGEIPPYEGARWIGLELANEQGADPSLRCFVGLASEWEDDPQHRPEYESVMIEEADRLVSGNIDG